MMTKKILLSINLLEKKFNRTLYRTSAEYAEMLGAKLTILTVVPNFGSYFLSSLPKEYGEQSRNKAETELAQSVEQNLDADSVDKTLIREGRVYKEILQHIEEEEYDLVIIGGHKPNHADAILGSNAARVVRFSKYPVLILRPEENA